MSNPKPTSKPPPPPDESRSLLSPPLRMLSGFWEKSGALILPRDAKGERYGPLLRSRPWAVVFCLGFVFSSSFGQTFFLSLFQGEWQTLLGLTAGQMGAIYGAATLASGLLLPWGGRWLDRATPARAARVVLLGLALGAFLTAGIQTVWMLALALFTLRFFGQGMSASLGVACAARWFSHNRGKALSLTSLGYPWGEALLPLAATALLALVGWRSTWVLVAGGILVVGWPLAHLCVRRSAAQGDALSSETEDKEDNETAPSSPGAPAPATQTTGRTLPLWRDPRFLLMLLVVAPMPFVGTGVIFFQVALAEARGWNAAVFPTGFALFAVVRALFSLSAGAWVDRVGPRRLLGGPALGFALALTCLTGSSTLAAIGFFVFMGMAFGASGAVLTAAWTELFGQARIGAVRGASASVAVFLTAAAPFLFGLALDHGIALDHLLRACVALLLILAWGGSLAVRTWVWTEAK